MNKRQKKKLLKKQNKELISKYPFLMPVNVWTGKPLPNYDYTYTLLDDMPIGWKKAFGKLLCEDIMNELVESNTLNTYSIQQIKEKYGTLRWYCSGGTEKIYDIIRKYEHISEFVCITCGKVNVPVINDGWISPQCKSCFNNLAQRRKKYGYNIDYDKIIDCKPLLTPTFKVKSYSKDKTEIITYDCTDILERMGVDIKSLPAFEDLEKKGEI